MKHSIQGAAKIVFVIAALVAAVSLQRATGASGAPSDDGAALFKANCASCHGEDGAGNTPVGKQLNVRNLRSAEVKKLSDAQLAAVIAKGKDKMPPFEKGLSKEQINQLVAHIRQSGKKGRLPPLGNQVGEASGGKSHAR